MSSWLYDSVSSHSEVVIQSFKSLFEQYSSVWISADVVLRSKCIDTNHSADLEFRLLTHELTLNSQNAQWNELRTHLDIVPLITTAMGNSNTLNWGVQYKTYVYTKNDIYLSTWYGGNGTYTGSAVDLTIKGRR